MIEKPVPGHPLVRMARVICLIVLTASWSACGGGSGGGESTPAATSTTTTAAVPTTTTTTATTTTTSTTSTTTAPVTTTSTTTTMQESIDGAEDLPSCGEQFEVFTDIPMDPGDFVSISPLGSTNPTGHTFPTVHTYLMLRDNSLAVPVYAPGDVTITNITLSSSYSITFHPCAEIKGYFDHVSTLTADISAQLSESDLCDWSSIPENSTPYCVNIEVATGALLGYTGGADADGSAALDFGLRDYMMTPITFSATEFITDSAYTACPYDYYESGDIKDGLFDKLRENRTESPVCGTVDYYVADTAQGQWYAIGSEDWTGEEGNIALVPANTDTAVGVLSIGDASIGADAYYFDFRSSGQVNRAFTDVAYDGNIYCYDTLRDATDPLESGNSRAISGYLYLEMIGDANLMLERVDQETDCPDPAGLDFSSTAVELER